MSEYPHKTGGTLMKVIKSTLRYSKPLYCVFEEITVMPNFMVELISPGANNSEECQKDLEKLVGTIESSSGSHVTSLCARNKEGDYIGDIKRAESLCDVHGIAPEKASDENEVCSIGFSETEQKWYGWSHRAWYGFGIGDIVEEGDCTASSGWTEDYISEHFPDGDPAVLPIGFEAKTLDDAKRMAIAFASSVS